MNMENQSVDISLKRFLLIEECPAAWQRLDLYLVRDDEVVFYVGQSHLAFTRLWHHLLNGFKGRSILGRFIWCNWPRSMRFTIELLSSQCAQFESVGHDLDAAERMLIQQASPCFNISHNDQPTPLPAAYFPPTADLRCSRKLKRLIHEAERAVKMEDNQRWA